MPSALNCFSRLLSCRLLCFFWSLRTVMPNTTTISFLILVLMLAFVTCDSLTSTITPLHYCICRQSVKPSDSTRYQQSHIKASCASISNGNFASTAPDAAFHPFLVSFLLPNHSNHLRVPTLTPIYPRAGQAPLHQRHNVLPRPTKRQTGFDRTLPRLLQTWRWHRHNSPPRWPTTHHTGSSVPIRHCRRTGQPNRRALSTARPVPLHVPDPPPARQHPVLLPLHRPAARRRDWLLQLHVV